MKTLRRGIEVEATRGQRLVSTGMWPHLKQWYADDDYICLSVENEYNSEESPLAELTPAEARVLAAELVRLADEIEEA